jgi:hypothetical protein
MAAEQNISPQNAAEKLSPETAEFFKSAEARSVPLIEAREVQVGWEYTTNDDYAELEWFLTHYTWATNKDVAKGQRFVEDPVVAGIPLPGIWRQAFVTRISRLNQNRQEVFWIVITLRKGYASTADNTEAYVDSGADMADTEEGKFFVTFPNIRPDKIQTVMSSLLARDTATDPKFGKTTLTGKYVYSKVEDRIQDDGSHHIRVTLTKVSDITDPIADLPALENTQRSWINILRNGEAECGREQGVELTWKGLNPDNKDVILDGIEADPTGFVNANVETVSAWDGDTVIGSHYKWVSGASSPKRNLVVEARIVFTMDATVSPNYEEALSKGWVTQSWEPLLPVKFEEQEDGTAVLVARIVDRRWNNVAHTAPDNDVTARSIQTVESNPGGHQQQDVHLYRGMPSSILPELIENIAPTTSDYVIGRIEASQNETEGVVSVSEAKTYNYIVDAAEPAVDYLEDGPIRILVYDVDDGLVQIVDHWPNIHKDNIGAHVALVANGLYSADFAVLKVNIDENGNGSKNLTRTQGLDESSSASAYYYEYGLATDDQNLYEKKTIRTTMRGGRQYYADVLMRYYIKRGWSHVSGTRIYGDRETLVTSGDAEKIINDGYNLDGSFFRNDGKNVYFFKKVFQMYTIHPATGAPLKAIPNLGSADLKWSPVSEEMA